jgi:hypothetical protein
METNWVLMLFKEDDFKMPTKAGQTVHPWYKGNHKWQVKDIAELNHPVEYHDPEQGDVHYNPKIMLLESQTKCRALWIAYWMSNNNEKMKWGQRPPVLEESVLLELMKNAIKKGMFSQDFINALSKELKDQS